MAYNFRLYRQFARWLYRSFRYRNKFRARPYLIIYKEVCNKRIGVRQYCMSIFVDRQGGLCIMGVNQSRR